MKTNKTPRSIRRRIIAKPHGEFHPSILTGYNPQHAFRPTEPGDKEHYGQLTNKTPYCEYAWEFLRRNRFFQANQDHRTEKNPGYASFNYDEEDWAPESSIEGIPASPGLVRNHHYTWNFRYLAKKGGAMEERVVEWDWIQSCRAQFRNWKQSGPRRPKNERDLDNAQVAVVIDLAPIVYNQLALKRQLEVVEREILEIAKHRNLTTNRKREEKAPNKNVLRNYLRVVDLFSPNEGERTMDDVTELYFSMYATDSGKDKTQQRSAISSLAKKAFEYVYEGDYLSLLAFDSWNQEPAPLIK